MSAESIDGDPEFRTRIDKIPPIARGFNRIVHNARCAQSIHRQEGAVIALARRMPTVARLVSAPALYSVFAQQDVWRRPVAATVALACRLL